MRVVRLFTGTDGESHVHDVQLDLAPQPARALRFQETPAGGALAWHDAPCRQYVITLSGRLEFTTRRGEVFEIGPGDVLLAEDTSGSGHSWRIVGPDPWRRAYVELER